MKREKSKEKSTFLLSFSLFSFNFLLLFGAALRLLALPLPGTHDIAVWKIWSYGAATEGVAHVYGVGGTPPERKELSLHGATSTVDYPPLAMYELAAIGHVYRWLNGGAYPDDVRLIVAVKVLPVVADAGILAVLCLLVKSRWAALVYWLNPAVLLDAAMLGYLDTLFVLPALGGLAAAAVEAPIWAGALAAAAVLTKPQAVVVVPAIAVAVVCVGHPAARLGRALRAAAAAAAVSLVVLLPIVRAGALPNLVNALSRLGHHDMLSGNASNVWWIVGWALRAYYSAHDMGTWAAWTAPARILAITRVVELGYPNPRTIGLALTASAAVWAIWKARAARDLWIAAALAAFLVHAFATLSAQVHENHLFAAVPLLAVAAAGRRAFTPVFIAVSAILAVNLNLFYGVSEDIGYALPRALAPIDLSVLLASINCGALIWHARVFRRECSTAAASRPAPGLASIPALEARTRW